MGGGVWGHTMTIYFDRLETVGFFRLFTTEGVMEYTGCGNTEHRGLTARVRGQTDRVRGLTARVLPI